MEENVWGDPTPSNTVSDSYTFKESSTISNGNESKLALIKESLSKIPSVDDPSINQLMVPWIELVELITDEDRDEEFRTFEQIVQNIKDANSKKVTGVAIIHYIIAYNRPNYIELLYKDCQQSPSKANLNLNATDDIVGYTPLMWAFLLERRDCIVELFNFSDSIDFSYRNIESGQTAWDMISVGSSLYNFLNENNMLEYDPANSHNTTNPQGKSGNINEFDGANKENDAIDNIDLKIAGMGLESGVLASNNDGFTNLHDSSDMYGTEYKMNQANSYEHFDFSKLVKYQYFEFADYDIPQILDLLTTLPIEHQHMTTYPAALLFQCIRYADRKKQSPQLVSSLCSLSFTRIIASIANTRPKDKSSHHNKEKNYSLSNATPLSAQDAENNEDNDEGVEGSKMSASRGDIVTQSYWISALTFLYYYLTKDESFFKRYPTVLQGIINTIHSVMIELTTSIHSRLSPLIEPTLINYTTIKDVEQTLYKKDWNFFKKRKQAKLQKKEKQKKLEQQRERKSIEIQEGDQNSDLTGSTNTGNALSRVSSKVSNNDSSFFDAEVLKHLLPPSLLEQMKPSPVKIVQIFGALNYVLNLHQVHPLFQQQCLSLSTSWFSTSLFNMVLKDRKKKTLSRARAIQIRLNLSSLESWIKNNDLLVNRPKLIDDFMWERFPYTLVQELNSIDMANPILHNVTTYKPIASFNESTVVTDTSNSLFYYQRFHKIANLQLEPLFELLQWLQIASTLDSEEALENTKELLPSLSNAQLVKAIDKYHYEVGEHKFNSKLKKALTNEIKRHGLVEKAYLDEAQIPLLTLPTVSELTDAYSNDSEYLPLLPNDIQDSMYDIHDENKKMRINDNGISNSSEGEEDETQENNINVSSDEDVLGGNELPLNNSDNAFAVSTSNNNNNNIFQEIDAPSATASHPSWANKDIDENPW